MRSALLPAVCLASFLGSAPLPAGHDANFELSILVDGCPAEEYLSRGRTYIEALRGKNFAIRLHNPTDQRVAVALSVDGLNVIDAKRTTALDATKWLLAPGQTLEIPGWQISGETARRFFFTDTRRSYAKWIGDTRNVGTIEAVFFREKRRPPQPIAKEPVRPLQRETAAEGGVPGGIAEGVPGSSADAPLRVAPSPKVGSEAVDPSNAIRPPEPEADRYAAAGIGERTRFPVQWVSFDEDPVPAASISLRYEFRRELVRLGVLTGDGDLYVRDRGRGFEREYAPDPGRR